MVFAEVVRDVDAVVVVISTVSFLEAAAPALCLIQTLGQRLAARG